jgi:hypothetical protein
MKITVGLHSRPREDVGELGRLIAARDMPAQRRGTAALDADITFNWPRLTWPSLALRHAGP